jgi:DNA-binding MurR/RpiR family transcriptional regulator
MRIARVILADYPQSGLAPASRLAAAAHTSPATATRLVAKLGYDSFFEFQTVIRDDVRRRLTSPSTRLRVARRSKAIAPMAWLHEAIESDIANLERTASLVDPRAFAALVAALARTNRKVFVAGSKKAASVALYLATQLRHIRSGCSLLSLSETLPDQLLDAQPDDLLVVIEPRRATLALMSLVQHCVDRGMTIAVICDEYPAPALARSPVLITVPASGPGPFDSYAALVTVINALIAALIPRLGRSSRARIDKLESINEEFRMWSAGSDLRPG